MSIVRYCACCGSEEAALAIVMDPFTDSTWGVCRTCLGPLYDKQMEVLRKQIEARGEVPGA